MRPGTSERFGTDDELVPTSEDRGLRRVDPATSMHQCTRGQRPSPERLPDSRGATSESASGCATNAPSGLATDWALDQLADTVDALGTPLDADEVAGETLERFAANWMRDGYEFANLGH